MNITETAEGQIPHLRIVLKECVIFAPVRLETEPTHNGGRRLVCKERYGREQLPVPARLRGEYLYALPGGGLTTASDMRGIAMERAA